MRKWKETCENMFNLIALLENANECKEITVDNKTQPDMLHLYEADYGVFVLRKTAGLTRVWREWKWDVWDGSTPVRHWQFTLEFNPWCLWDQVLGKQ